MKKYFLYILFAILPLYVCSYEFDAEIKPIDFDSKEFEIGFDWNAEKFIPVKVKTKLNNIVFTACGDESYEQFKAQKTNYGYLVYCSPTYANLRLSAPNFREATFRIPVNNAAYEANIYQKGEDASRYWGPFFITKFSSSGREHVYKVNNRIDSGLVSIRIDTDLPFSTIQKKLNAGSYQPYETKYPPYRILVNKGTALGDIFPSPEVFIDSPLLPFDAESKIEYGSYIDISLENSEIVNIITSLSELGAVWDEDGYSGKIRYKNKEGYRIIGKTESSEALGRYLETSK